MRVGPIMVGCMDWPKALALAVSILALAGIVVIQTNGIQSSVDTFRTEAAADRRAHQAAMDIFRKEMQRLAERQSRVEGELEAVRPMISNVPRSREDGTSG